MSSKSLKMVADSTQSDLTVEKKHKRSSSLRRTKEKKEKSNRKSTAKVKEKPKSKVKEKIVNKKEKAEPKKPKRSKNPNPDLDLTKDLQDIASFINDRKTMLEEMFRSVKGSTFTGLLPDFLQKMTRLELKRRCFDQLEVMSKKRIRRIIAGDVNEDISSSGTEEESSEEGEPSTEQGETKPESQPESSLGSPQVLDTDEQHIIEQHLDVDSTSTPLESDHIIEDEIQADSDNAILATTSSLVCSEHSCKSPIGEHSDDELGDVPSPSQTHATITHRTQPAVSSPPRSRRRSPARRRSRSRSRTRSRSRSLSRSRSASDDIYYSRPDFSSDDEYDRFGRMRRVYRQPTPPSKPEPPKAEDHFMKIYCQIGDTADASSKNKCVNDSDEEGEISSESDAEVKDNNVLERVKKSENVDHSEYGEGETKLSKDIDNKINNVLVKPEDNEKLTRILPRTSEQQIKRSDLKLQSELVPMKLISIQDKELTTKGQLECTSETVKDSDGNVSYDGTTAKIIHVLSSKKRTVQVMNEKEIQWVENDDESHVSALTGGLVTDICRFISHPRSNELSDKRRVYLEKNKNVEKMIDKPPTIDFRVSVLNPCPNVSEMQALETEAEALISNIEEYDLESETGVFYDAKTITNESGDKGDDDADDDEDDDDGNADDGNADDDDDIRNVEERIEAATELLKQQEQANNADNSDSKDALSQHQMEILELEMRARAIKAMLKAAKH